MPEKQSGSSSDPVADSRAHATPNALGLAPQSASLEGLAIQLQYEILQSLADLPSLDAIVHASPSYHRVYVTGRQAILAKMVSRDIGPGILVEPHAVAMALAKDGPEIRGFLKDYRSTRRKRASVTFEKLPLPHVTILSQTQVAVRDAMEDFCQATLSRHPWSSERKKTLSRFLPTKPNVLVEPSTDSKLSARYSASQVSKERALRIA